MKLLPLWDYNLSQKLHMPTWIKPLCFFNMTLCNQHTWCQVLFRYFVDISIIYLCGHGLHPIPTACFCVLQAMGLIFFYTMFICAYTHLILRGKHCTNSPVPTCCSGNCPFFTWPVCMADCLRSTTQNSSASVTHSWDLDVCSSCF